MAGRHSVENDVTNWYSALTSSANQIGEVKSHSHRCGRRAASSLLTKARGELLLENDIF
jgi:hypothetical protein